MKEGTGFGSGWISGTISAALGPMAFGGVLCLRFPELLSSPHLREIYPMGWIRGLLHVCLVASFALGTLSLILRRNKILGGVGVGFSLAGALLGGAYVPVEGPVLSPLYLGLDWFLLDLFLLALVFVPLERLFARVEQPIFREGWRTDLTHFLVSHVLVQLLVLLTVTPAAALFRRVLDHPLPRAIGAQPAWLQFLEIVVVADLAGYAVHRLFHAVPVLWRFHAVHHSSRAMDWLAGSRLHLVDIIVTRAWVFLPLYALGFAQAPLYAYLVFVALHAVFVHANVRFRFDVLAPFLGTPRFHHWHHAADVADKNFAIHLPFIDRLFGTHHLPGKLWPSAYGLADEKLPEGYGGQLLYPFRNPTK